MGIDSSLDGGFVENPDRPQYPIESVDNALKLLVLFSERSQVRLGEASAYLGVASSTAHRLLAMLRYRGFVRQDPSSKVYEPGPVLASMGLAAPGDGRLRLRARPILERLWSDVRET